MGCSKTFLGIVRGRFGTIGQLHGNSCCNSTRSVIFSPSVIASLTIILAPHVNTSGSTPTVRRRSSDHSSQYSPGDRQVDGLNENAIDVAINGFGADAAQKMNTVRASIVMRILLLYLT